MVLLPQHGAQECAGLLDAVEQGKSQCHLHAQHSTA
jgi:hypothetical protein